MIRVNLLGIKKEVGRAPAVSVEGAKLTFLLVIFLAAAVVVLVVDWQRISSQKAKLDTREATALKEKAELAAVKTEVEQAKRKGQELDRQIQIIEALKEGQTGPVYLLNTLVDTVALSKVEDNEHLWLTNFVSKDKTVSMNGVAASVNTVADFITNLKNSGRFKSVEIQQSYQEDQAKDFPTFIFTINAALAQPASAGGAPGMP
jgi:Tfp pilus assembly protein PilN